MRRKRNKHTNKQIKENAGFILLYFFFFFFTLRQSTKIVDGIYQLLLTVHTFIVYTYCLYLIR